MDFVGIIMNQLDGFNSDEGTKVGVAIMGSIVLHELNGSSYEFHSK
jgi:hypothetical protein